MQTTLYFVRHGHVYNPQQIIYARLPRFRLSDEGVQQAILAAAVLKDVHPAAIYTSPMLRARQTAGYIAREHPGGHEHVPAPTVRLFASLSPRQTRALPAG